MHMPTSDFTRAVTQLAPGTRREHTYHMATPTLISVEDYLHTSYDPDCDYIDGEVQERNMGEGPHSLMQMALSALFYANRRVWRVRPLPEQRVQTSATHFRIPDICLIRMDDPMDDVIRVPPLLCVEIISSEQSTRDMQERTDDYLAMGVRQVWIIDPVRRRAFMPDASGILRPQSGTLSVDGTLVRVPLADIFQEYDDLAAGR